MPAMPAARTESPIISKSGEFPPMQDVGPDDVAALQMQIFESRALIAIALRRDGFTQKEIATKTGLTVEQIKNALRQVRAAGRLQDVFSLLDHRAVPQAVDNLIDALEDEKHPHHWDATKEVLHGRGAFRKFNTNKGEGEPGDRLPPLQIAIINPKGGQELPTVIVNSTKGSVVGAPRSDDGLSEGTTDATTDAD